MASNEPLVPHSLSSELVQTLLDEPVIEKFAERRAAARHPLFCPVVLRSTRSDAESHSAFSRELSSSGIGLILGKSLARGDVYELTLERNGQTLQKRVEIVWSREVGKGWYQSGCRFIH